MATKGLAAIEAPTIGLADVGLDAAGVVATRSGHKSLACLGLAPYGLLPLYSLDH